MYARIVMQPLLLVESVVMGSMDIQAIMTLVGSLGFPIAACVGIFWMLNKERDEHKDEMTKVTEAINNNTLALTVLTERISKDG